MLGALADRAAVFEHLSGLTPDMALLLGHFKRKAMHHIVFKLKSLVVVPVKCNSPGAVCVKIRNPRSNL